MMLLALWVIHVCIYEFICMYIHIITIAIPGPKCMSNKGLVGSFESFGPLLADCWGLSRGCPVVWSPESDPGY